MVVLPNSDRPARGTTSESVWLRLKIVAFFFYICLLHEGSLYTQHRLSVCFGNEQVTTVCIV